MMQFSHLGTSPIMRKWKLLFIKDCEHKSLISTMPEFLNSCQDETACIIVPEIMLKNQQLIGGINELHLMLKWHFSFNSCDPWNLTYWTSFGLWIKILWTCSYCRVIGLLDTVPVLQYCREDVERLERRWTEAQGRRIRELRAEQQELKEELAAAKTRLLIPATRWSYERKWVIILTLLLSINLYHSVVGFEVRFHAEYEH